MADVAVLDEWDWAFEEPSGDTDKQWLVEPQTDLRWLFKPNKPNRSPDEASSEVAASLLAKGLNLPAATVKLGQRGATRGCISLNVVTEPFHGLVDAAILLSAIIDDFDPKDRKNRGHDQPNIVRILSDLDGPRGAAPGTNAIETFGGYPIFDALIGNTDRHSKNWAIETSLTGRDLLAPTFDHATSMGITTRGPARDTLLGDPSRIPIFAAKATAHRFADGGHETLVGYAVRFLRLYAPREIALWYERLSAMGDGTIAAAVGESEMTDAGASLAIAVVTINRERIMRCLSSP